MLLNQEFRIPVTSARRLLIQASRQLHRAVAQATPEEDAQLDMVLGALIDLRRLAKVLPDYSKEDELRHKFLKQGETAQ